MNLKQLIISSSCNCKSEWKLDDEAYDIIINDEKKANFMYRTVQEKLQSTIDSHSFLEKKILILLSYLITIITVIMVVIVKSVNLDLGILEQSIPFYWQLVSVLILFTLNSMILICFLTPKDFFYKGNDVENILDKNYCSASYTQMIVGESIIYKERIEHNDFIIKKGAYLFNKITMITIILPIILFVFH